MVDPSVVHSSPQAGPATHVLIIGVGHYPHLIGGGGPLLPEHQGLGQLSSPPESARALADWFTSSFRSPNRPLGSVRLLLSEANSRPWTNPVTGKNVAASRAGIAEVEAAFKGWHADGNTNAENLVIFYFCGHGMASGAFTALLAEDFGSDPGNALAGAIDFYRNRIGMSSCSARQQLFLVDACRTNAKMTREAADYAGRVFTQPAARAGRLLRPVLYSTLLGQEAHGRANTPSHFAEAVLAAFRGAGGDRSQGDWRIRTSTLHLAIEAHMARKIRAGLASDQISPADELITFDVHHLPTAPEVPVIVSCKPQAALAAAELKCLLAGNVLHQRAPQNSDWELALRVGEYDFEATFPHAQPPYQAGRRAGEYVSPPELNVPLEVAQ